MISQFIKALQHLHLDPTDEDIADILWLALHLGPPPAIADMPNQPSDNDDSNSIAPDGSSTESLKEPVSFNTPGKLYLDARTGTYEGKITNMLPFRAPAASALPGTLALGRALRPLMRKVPSHTKSVIDEVQTAQRIAETGLWLPVMVPAQERWLEVALVVDESRSMAIWWHTIVEFQTLLERHGAFRDIRIWGLVTDENGQNARLRMGIGRSARGQPTRTPSELLDPSGRRLILVISDCVKQAWYNGTIVDVLTKWGKHNPMALIQVLPQSLWTMSALGNADAARLRARVPGQANMQLTYYLVNDNWINRKETNKWLRLPTVTLEPGPLTDWARALMGAAWARGYVLDTRTDEIDAFKNVNEDGQEGPLSAEERLKRFFAIASPTARKLAGLLAATPIILPIVRVIQQTMLPKSQLSHIAEVFLGGLLEQIPEQSSVDADEIQYDFIPGIRELLLNSQPTNESSQVLRNVSSFIEDRFGQFLDFRALLADPTSLSPIENIRGDNIRQIQPFAEIGAMVLRRLGGRYADIADQLELKIETSLPVVPPMTTEKVRSVDEKKFTAPVINVPRHTSPSVRKIRRSDIAIITIREDEYAAVFDRLEEHDFKDWDGPSGRAYATFLVPTITKKVCEVALVRSPDQGNDASQKVATDMLRDLDPQLLLVVGIAGGVPNNEFTLGDVIISSRIDNFNLSAADQGKITYNKEEGGIHPRIGNIAGSLSVYRSSLAGWNILDGIKRPPVDLSQVQSNIHGDQEWRDEVLTSLTAQFGESASRSQLPLFKTGIVASSNTLVKDTDIPTQWLMSARNILAIEMESAGVLQATQLINKQCPVMTICGISDIIGLKRDARWTAYACQSAAAFTYAFIKTGIIEPRYTLAAAAASTGTSTTATNTVDSTKPAPLYLFISYSAKDEKFKVELEKHLIMLTRNGTIHSMDSQQIEPGKKQDEITKAIDQSQIILLLISQNFLAESRLYDVEMQRAMERHEDNSARVVPIIISSADIEETPFSKLIALPRSLQPIDKASNRDVVWNQIAKEIRGLCNSLLARQKQA